MPQTSTQSKVQRHQQIINEYIAAHQCDDFSMRDVARWAIDNDLWNSEPYDPERICARELSQAARQEFYSDPQGREVRRKHCYVITEPDGQRRWHWIDIGSAPQDKMHLALQQRRQAAFGDVKQLFTDKESYNDNNPYGAQIQMSFNFDEDLAELAQPHEYPEGPEDSQP